VSGLSAQFASGPHDGEPRLTAKTQAGDDPGRIPECGVLDAHMLAPCVTKSPGVYVVFSTQTPQYWMPFCSAATSRVSRTSMRLGVDRVPVVGPCRREKQVEFVDVHDQVVQPT